jgi:hypothetical protein
VKISAGGMVLYSVDLKGFHWVDWTAEQKVFSMVDMMAVD